MKLRVTRSRGGAIVAAFAHKGACALVFLDTGLGLTVHSLSLLTALLALHCHDRRLGRNRRESLVRVRTSI